MIGWQPFEKPPSHSHHEYWIVHFVFEADVLNNTLFWLNIELCV